MVRIADTTALALVFVKHLEDHLKLSSIVWDLLRAPLTAMVGSNDISP